MSDAAPENDEHPLSTPARLKRALLTSYAASYAASFASLLALWVTFGLLIEQKPSQYDDCKTGLYGGLYGDLLVPFHLVAYVVMATATAYLSRRAREDGKLSWWVLAALLAGGAFSLISTQFSGAFSWLGFGALLAVLPVAGAFALIAGALVFGARKLPEGQRWSQHARVGRVGLWVLLSVGLPATFAMNYVGGAGLNCLPS